MITRLRHWFRAFVRDMTPPSSEEYLAPPGKIHWLNVGDSLPYDIDPRLPEDVIVFLDGKGGAEYIHIRHNDAHE